MLGMATPTMSEKDPAQALEDAKRYLGWHPFRVFSEIIQGGPFVIGLVGLALIASAILVWRVFGPIRHSESFFGMSLFLALVPFISFSIICFLKVYTIIWTSNHAGHFDVIGMAQSAGHFFQLGILLSGCLLLSHTVVYVISRGSRTP
jgi:hypothetical protein